MAAEIKTPMKSPGAIAGQFINSKLTPLFIAVLAAGWEPSPSCMTPREEEPQIVVPMLDVFVADAGGVGG